MVQNNEPQKVEFEEFRQPSQSFQTTTPKITEWVMKHSGGTIKNEKQANYVLIGFVVVAIVISLFLFLGEKISNNPEDTKVLPVELSPLSP